MKRRGPSVEPVSSPSRAVLLPEACERIGISYRMGAKLVAEGRFPVPELPRVGTRGRHRYSTYEIEHYLQNASVADAR